MNFTDRTTYLAWVLAWKTAYQAHSRATRGLKLEFKQAQREGAARKVETLRGKLREAAAHARDLVEQRHQSKLRAQQQYLAQRASAAA